MPITHSLSTFGIIRTVQNIRRIPDLILLITCLTFWDHRAAAEPRLALPTAQQLVWHDYEMGTFIHFGPSTFIDWVIDWPTPEYRAKGVEQHQLPDKPEHMFDPRNFNPQHLDTDQWVAAAEAMGSKYLVMVAKHHGGFCVWQTDTSEYSVRNTPWKNGRGDIMADLAESCRKRGMRLGVYLSPQDHVHGAGGGGRCRNPRDQERYNRIYRQQLTELLTRYGKMAEVWFDGGQVVEVGDILRQHAPDAVIFQGAHANIRWVGNEDGFAPYPCWNSVLESDAKTGVATGDHGNPNGTSWLPCECDTKIRGQWHWASDKTPWGSKSLKSLDVLMDTYYRSVGHGQVLLLNHSPDVNGRITAADFRRGAEMGTEIRRRFGRSLAETEGRGMVVELDLKKPMRVDHVITMEEIALGERIRSYVLEGFGKGEWRPLVSGSAVGHKKIDRFEAVEVSRIRLRTTSSVQSPVVKKLAAYHVGKNEPGESRPAAAPVERRIELWVGSLTSGGETLDVSRHISEPGQYEVLLRAEDGKPATGGALRLLIDGTEAPEYLRAKAGSAGTFNLNITATRSWPEGSIVLIRSGTK